MLPAFHLGHIVIYTYGVMLGVGILVAFDLLRKDFRRRSIAIPTASLTAYIAIAGLVGSKFDSALVQYLRGKAPVFHGGVTEWLSTGHTWFGAELAGMLVIAIVAKVYKEPVLKVLDVMPVICPAYAIGRIGCFLAGDGDYGPPTDVPWGVRFPHGLVPSQVSVHPTMLYNAVWEMAVFLFLWPQGRPSEYSRFPKGTILGEYLVLTGVGRFAIEFVSRNVPVWLKLTEAQIVGLLMMGVGICVLVGRTVNRSMRPRLQSQ